MIKAIMLGKTLLTKDIDKFKKFSN